MGSPALNGSVQLFRLRCEALILLVLSTLAIRILPFRVVVGHLRRASPGMPSRHREDDVARVRSAIDAASRRLPWRVVCFPRGLTMRLMLHNRGIPSDLHYGVAVLDDAISAHVWVTVDGHLAIGGEGIGDHACLMRVLGGRT